MIPYFKLFKQRKSGFTLIELMIAISLGFLIVYTAIAGLRTAAQSVSIVNRLHIETSLLRSGLQQAHDHMDFWTDIDDPVDLGAQTYRKPGLPFAYMKDVFPYKNNSDKELITGWNPKEQWSATDSRTWWTGDISQTHNTNRMLGCYAIFGNSTSPANIPKYGSVNTPHSWLYKQIWGLHGAFGWYGFFDYLPAGTMIGCHIYNESMSDPLGKNGKNPDGMATLFLNDGSFSFGPNAMSWTKGRWRLSTFSAYGLVSPTYNGSTNPSIHRKVYNVGYANRGNGAATDGFLREIDNRDELLPNGKPESWPIAEVSVSRLIKTGRFVSLCSVKMTSVYSGETVQINFSGFGTTLRGARQQRRLQGGGWADWDGATHINNDLTLDDTP